MRSFRAILRPYKACHSPSLHTYPAPLSLSLNLPRPLYYSTKQSKPIPPKFIQRVFLTDGSSYVYHTTSPKPQIKLVKDTRNHPLWNEYSDGMGLFDESGRLSKFSSRYGETDFKLEFLESDEKLPELSAKEAAKMAKANQKGKKKGGK